MIDTIKFIAKHYYNDDSLQGIERVDRLLRHSGVHVYGSIADGVIMVYITLSDEGLAILKSVKTEDDFKNGLSDKLMKYPGRNIYVFRLVTEGNPSLDTLRKCREEIVKKHHATRFSWHDNARVQLHTYEVKHE